MNLRRVGAASAVIALLFTMVGTVQPAPVAASASLLNVTYTLEGCNLDHGGTYNNDGTVTCDNSAYTTGNLGKSWAELDLVPLRATLDNGSGSTQSGDFIIAGDYKNGAGTATGWDAIGAQPGGASAAGPHLNTALSAPNCPAITWGSTQITPSGSGVGGADQTIYREITASIPANTICVYDYWQRLSLGAHLFSGSSLQANLWAPDLSSSGIGQKRIQLPVAQLLPPTISKDMTASQPVDYAWAIQKNPTPASLDFGNVCAPDAATQLPLSVSVTWQRLAATPGAITVITHVYATNVAHRDLTITATDNVYSGTTLLYSIAGSPTVVAANTANVLVLSDTRTVPSGTSSLNDSATATVTDTFTSLPVPGTLGPVTVAATVQQGTVTNGTASIADSESITGTGLQFSVAAPSSGSFSGYTAGAKTTGPVAWGSGTVSGNGSITFGKTVYVPAQTVASGTLSDTASLTGSDGFTTSATASVSITSHAAGKVTINKTIPAISGAVSFTFHVLDAASVDHPVTLNFASYETSKSATVSDLPLGTTTVSEDAVTGWTPQAPHTFTLGCSASVSFNNTFVPASARVAKVTNPAGTSSWDMVLTGPGTPVGGVHATAVAGAGFVSFNFALQEGSYTVTETPQAGYDQGSAVGCSFTVSYPADFSRVFSCTFTNIERGTIIVKKVTNPTSATDQFTFTGDAAGSIGNGGQIVVSNLVPGTYTSTEAALAGWDLTSIACDDGSSVTPSTTNLASATATFKLDPGETITCTFTNTERGHIIVNKVTHPTGASQSFAFTTTGSGYTGFSLTDGQSHDSGALVPGSYSVAETAVAGWDLTSATCDSGTPAALTLQAGQTIHCTFTNTQRGNVALVKTYNGGPIPAGASFVFTVRSGASASAAGTVLYTTTVDSTTTMPVALAPANSLRPGTYQVCETVPGPGWNTTLSAIAGSFIPPDGLLNGIICAPVTVTAGATTTLTIDNTPPPGGMALTIGYWKTHSCQAPGKQADVLDATLATFPIAVGQTTHGFFVGKLYVDTCNEAVSLLSKSPINSTVNKASDPVFNFAAQYVAYRLNVQAGSYANSTAAAAASGGQAILVAVNFNGITHLTLTYAQATALKADASILDKYNNDRLPGAP